MAIAMKRATFSSGKLATRRAARSVVVVRAEAEKPAETPAMASTTAPAEVSAPPPAAAAPVTPPPAAAAPSFGNAMAFAGPAPETINGRLAMLGFVAALGAELSSGKPVLEQLDGAAVPIAATFVLFSVASLIPMLKGVKTEAFGPLTPKAETLNGQAAMIGFAFLLIIEAIKGSALF